MKALEALERVISLAETGVEMIEAINGPHALNSERDAIQIAKIVVELELLHPEADKAVRKELEG